MYAPDALLRALSCFVALQIDQRSYAVQHIPKEQANKVEQYITRDSRFMIRLTLPCITVRWHSPSLLTQNTRIPSMCASEGNKGMTYCRSGTIGLSSRTHVTLRSVSWQLVYR
jgi:hypothetical protein